MLVIINIRIFDIWIYKWNVLSRYLVLQNQMFCVRVVFTFVIHYIWITKMIDLRL